MHQDAPPNGAGARGAAAYKAAPLAPMGSSDKPEDDEADLEEFFATKGEEMS
jgi:hypothetical protein